MKRFQSRLDALKRIREQTEQLAKLEAAVRRQQAVADAQRVQEIQNNISRQQAEGAKLASAGMIEALQATAVTTARLQVSQREANQKKVESEKKLNEAVQLVAEAQQQLEIVETKIDRERTEHRRQVFAEQENDRQERSAIRHTHQDVR